MHTTLSKIMTTISNSMERAISIWLCVNYFLNLVKQVDGITQCVNNLKCVGVKHVLIDLKNYITKIMGYKVGNVTGINVLFGECYLNSTYCLVLEEEQRKQSQKHPLVDVTNTSSLPPGNCSILTRPNLRKRAKTVNPPRPDNPVLVSSPAGDNYYTPWKICDLSKEDKDGKTRKKK